MGSGIGEAFLPPLFGGSQQDHGCGWLIGASLPRERKWRGEAAKEATV